MNEFYQFQRLSEHDALQEAETMRRELGNSPQSSDYELLSSFLDAKERRSLTGGTIHRLEDLRNGLDLILDHKDEVGKIIMDKIATLPEVFNKLRENRDHVTGEKLASHFFLSFTEAEKYPFIRTGDSLYDSKHGIFNGVIQTYLCNKDFKTTDEVLHALQALFDNLQSERSKVEEVITRYSSEEAREADEKAIAQWGARKAEMERGRTENLSRLEKELREKPYEIPRNFFFKGTCRTSKAGYYYVNPHTIRDDEWIVLGVDHKKMNDREFRNATVKMLDGKFVEELQIVPDKKLYLDCKPYKLSKTEKREGKETIVDDLKEMLDKLREMNVNDLKQRGPEFEKHLPSLPVQLFKDLLFKVFYPGKGNRAFAELVGVKSELAQSELYYALKASGAWGPGPVRKPVTIERMVKNAIDGRIEEADDLDTIDPDDLLEFKRNCGEVLERRFSIADVSAEMRIKTLEALEKQLTQIPCCKYKNPILIKHGKQYEQVLDLLDEEEDKKVIRI